MTDATDQDSATATPAEVAEIVEADQDEEREGAILEPARVMRIGSMIRQLLEEVRAAPLDEASRDRLRGIYETSVTELGESLSSDLSDELSRLALPFDSDTPTESELRIAQAQLVGWLEGLFHGIQAALMSQQLQARQQLEQMRGQPQLGPGGRPAVPPSAPGRPSQDPPPGVYL